MVVDACIVCDSLATDVCTECEHEIAAHTYQFSIEEEFQVRSLLLGCTQCYIIITGVLNGV